MRFVSGTGRPNLRAALSFDVLSARARFDNGQVLTMLCSA